MDSATHLCFHEIPIERHWELSLRLHDELGHTEPWEICEDNCDELASDAIRIIFGQHTHAEDDGDADF